MPVPYLTVRDVTEHEIEVRHSRFICALAPVDSEDAAREFVAERKRRWSDATHNCSAHVIGARAGHSGAQKADDDGEPGGTAGTPMLEVLNRRGYADVAAVVTRYFGGVLLGAGGLARAYGGAVSETLDRAESVRMIPARVVRVTADHAQAGRLESDLRASPYALRHVDYGDRVTFEVNVALDGVPGFEEWLATATAGRAVPSLGEHVHVAE
ncbi:YigZ family protein [Planotetraspora sp. GP83]|uniref:YigZ family protein n=1 Tax=Planotetraspora sp. GP83 TaxID=3156264 RepID=UPI0035114EBF